MFLDIMFLDKCKDNDKDMPSRDSKRDENNGRVVCLFIQFKFTHLILDHFVQLLCHYFQGWQEERNGKGTLPFHKKYMNDGLIYR